MKADCRMELIVALVPKEHWSLPEWIDEERAKKAREDMEQRNIIYGGSLPYRHMCRFQSGFFWRQPVLDEYDWYWRVVHPHPIPGLCTLEFPASLNL